MLAILISAIGGLACIPWRIAVQVSYRDTEQIGKEIAALNQQLEKNRRLPPVDAIEVSRSEFRLLPEVALPFAVGFTWILVRLVDREEYQRLASQVKRASVNGAERVTEADTQKAACRLVPRAQLRPNHASRP